MCEIYNFALTIIGSPMVGPFIVCNIIPTICHSYDSLHNKFLNGTYLVNPIAATCSVGCAVVQLGVAVAEQTSSRAPCWNPAGESALRHKFKCYASAGESRHCNLYGVMASASNIEFHV